MTKFETIGVELQHDSEDSRESVKRFLYSCRVCCTKGIHLECDRCAIAATHKMMLASFQTEHK